MLRQKMRNIPLSRDEGQCAAVVRGVRKFSKLPTLPHTIKLWLKPVTLFIIGKGILFPKGPLHKCPHGDEPSEKNIQNFLISMTNHIHRECECEL